MLVSQTAEYALRAVVFLAQLPEGTSATSRDVSRGTSIPQTYAAKVLRRMVAHGLLSAQKGHGGGFRLARSPERIRYLDVFEAVNEDLEGQRCAFGWDKCSSRKPCALHESVCALNETVVNWARARTVAQALRSVSVRPGGSKLGVGGG